MLGSCFERFRTLSLESKNAQRILRRFAGWDNSRIRTKVRLAQNRAIDLANYILQSAGSHRAGMFYVDSFVV